MKPPCDSGVIHSADIPAPAAADPGHWILAVAILGSSMAFIDSTVVNVALPAMQASLGGTIADMQWIVEAYGVFLGALILVGGSLGDLFGRKRMFLVGVALFAAASVGCGFATSIHQLIAARAVQGVGGAFLVPGSLSLISASFRENERGRAIGTWSGFTAMGAALGPVAGGWLAEHASWRWVFFINVPLGVLVFVLSLWRVPETRSAVRGNVDWIGGLIVTVGLGAVAYGFIESATLGWSRLPIWATLGGGSFCSAAFLLFESRTDSPMVPLELFRSRDFSGANLITLFLYAALGMFLFLLPLNLIQVQHYSATAAGAAMLPLILLLFLLSRWSGGLVARYGPRRPLIVGPLIAAMGFALFTVPSIGGNYWQTFLPAFLVLGFGMAVSVAPLTTVVMNAVGQDRAGAASGINNAVARVAGLLSIAVMGPVILAAFSSHFNHSLQNAILAPTTMQNLKSHEDQLSALIVPREVDSATAVAITFSIKRAFVFAFRLVMMICASLSIASALFAWRMIARPRSPGLSSR